MSKLIKSFNVRMGEPTEYEEEIEEQDIVEENYEEDILNDLNNIPNEEYEDFTRKKVEEILERAKHQADIIAEESANKTEEEREIILEQARKNGFEEGYNQAIQQFEELIQEAGEIKQQALDEYKQLIIGSEEEIIEIIFDVAKKVLNTELKTIKEDIIYVVKDALEACTHKEYILLKVSKDDFENINKSKNKLLAMVTGIGEIEIKVDRSLQQGSCLIETPFGAIDGGVETKVDQIKKAFKGLVEASF